MIELLVFLVFVLGGIFLYISVKDSQFIRHVGTAQRKAPIAASLRARLLEERDLLLQTSGLLQGSGLSLRQQHSILTQLNELQQEFHSVAWQISVGAENAQASTDSIIAKSRQFRQTFAS